MPQFDPSTFLSQIFWLAVTFSALYLVVAYMAGPRLADVMEQRRRTIADDLEKARLLKAEAEGVIAAYEKALEKAHSEARSVLKKAQDEVAEWSVQRSSEAAQRLNETIKQGEARIAQARADSLQSIKEVALGLSSDIIEKIGGTQVSPDALQTALARVEKDVS